MATSVKNKEVNGASNAISKPSAVVKPVQRTRSTRTALVGVANQPCLVSRGGNRERGGEGGLKQTTRATRAASTQETSRVEAAAAVREEKEREDQKKKAVATKTTRTRTVATRVSKTTTTAQSRLPHPKDAATNCSQRSVTTATNTRQTTTAAGGVRTKITRKADIALGNRARRVAGLVAEDGDIRRTDGRYYNTRSRTTVADDTTTSDAGHHNCQQGGGEGGAVGLPKPRKVAATRPEDPAEEPTQLAAEPQGYYRTTSLELVPYTPKADIDLTDDPSMAGEYAGDVYVYHRQLEEENHYLVCATFLEHQRQITSSHRRVLVDWLAQVHFKYRLMQETMLLTVDILDRYLQIAIVTKSKLQLVGLASLFISSKFEEIYAPSVHELEHIAANTYTRREILGMEKMILEQLDYRLLKPYPIHFLRRFSRLSRADTNVHHLAKYFIDLSLLETEGSAILPSKKAAAAFIIAKVNLYGSPAGKVWTEDLALHTGYSLRQLSEAVGVLLSLVKGKHTLDKAIAIRDKYIKTAPTDQLKTVIKTGQGLEKVKITV